MGGSKPRLCELVQPREPDAFHWKQKMFNEVRVSLVAEQKKLPIYSPSAVLLDGDGYLVYKKKDIQQLPIFLARHLPEMDVAARIKLMVKVASVSAELHQAGIFHGALETQNFVVKSGEKVLLNGGEGLAPTTAQKTVAMADYSTLAPEVAWTRRPELVITPFAFHTKNEVIMLLLPLVILPVILAEQSKIKCPDHCECDLELQMVTCSGHLLLTLPDTIPPTFNILIVKDALIRSLTKNTFRKMEQLREFRMENCPQMSSLEKFAFKGLRKLRVIHFSDCPQLAEIPKAAFSGIANENGLRIIFQKTPIQRVHGGAFRHASNIRELSISGSDLALSRHAFASITQLDFLTVSGISLIEPQLFSNSTRFHIIHFKDSNVQIPPRAFEDLAYVHQFLIQRSRLPVIAEDAFSGISTIETVELFDNQIGKLSPRSFTGIENIGRLRIARNTIQTLDSPESVLSTAVQTRVEENTLDCSCSLKWMPSHPDRRLVDVNYCGAAAVYRSVRSYLKQHCEGGHVQRSVNSAQQTASNHDRLLPSASVSPALFPVLLLIYLPHFYCALSHLSFI